MNSSQIFFSSRLSFRAIFAATLSSFSLMTLFMLMSAGFGLWKFGNLESQQLSAGFWIWIALSWVVSQYISGYVAAIASRSITRRDGALHGFVTWSSACALACLIIFVAVVPTRQMEMDSTPINSWFFVIGDALALVASILGGTLGSKGESKAEVREMKQLQYVWSTLKPATSE